MENFKEFLKNHFKLEDFREGQLEIIKCVMDGNDTIIFMPTGAGKSLIYQFAGLYEEGLTIVISPLISLMKDQNDKLNNLGIHSKMLNSSISNDEKIGILNELISGNKNKIKFLYIAPERLNDEKFLDTIKYIDINLIAIDEAHCISQWGHDFRPSYLKIATFIKETRKNKNIKILGLTATATKKVKDDIILRLGLKNPKEFIKGFDRKNIIFLVKEISKEKDKLDKVLEIIQKTPPYGIIYCSSRKTVSKVYNFLIKNGVKVGMYTGEMDLNYRDMEQNNFMNSINDVIVATNAFGMGIDKKDIRYVIHYNLPGSIENYYQEVGRAGRDGKNSYGIIMASFQDTFIQEFFIKNSFPKSELIMKFYNYLYSDLKIGEGKGFQILKTYVQMAQESGIENGNGVGGIINILEKYGILKKGITDDDGIKNFRGKGITLLLPKLNFVDLPILWDHQENLKNEAYFRLDKIKDFLFKPGCRKKYILDYFGDTESMKKIGDNCSYCDYCIDIKNFVKNNNKSIIPNYVFLSVLNFIKNYDEKYGMNILSSILAGKNESKIIERGLNKIKEYSLFSVYSKETIQAIFEVLIEVGFLYKSFSMYPKIGIQELGRNVLLKNELLKDYEEEIQSKIYVKTKNFFSLESKKVLKKEKNKSKNTNYQKNTFIITKEMFLNGLSIKEIAKQREYSEITIQGHLIKLYKIGELKLDFIMKFSKIENLKIIKDIILNNNFTDNPLKDIKELCPLNISYLDIKIAKALLEKRAL